MPDSSAARATWRRHEVRSPLLPNAVPVVVAKDVPILPDADRMQNLSLYARETEDTLQLIGRPVDRLPGNNRTKPSTMVHIHGGAWRDPQLTSASVEPAVALAFTHSGPSELRLVASLNYRLAPFPTHPSAPYDPEINNHSDHAREAIHPAHVSDVLHGLALLGSLGLGDGAYVLSGHSCGAWLAFQAILGGPGRFGIGSVADAPRPAAIVGLNGLYDLPNLVSGLGSSHAHLSGEYRMLLSNAFGTDEASWAVASPSRLEAAELASRVQAGLIPDAVIVDQSEDDQLVPMNQRDALANRLREVAGLTVKLGHRCAGGHAKPWEDGRMLWESVQDAFELAAENRTSRRALPITRR